MLRASETTIECLPVEVLDRIYAWLKKCPWKWPLGQTSTYLYHAFQIHVEHRKKRLVRSPRALRYAANWGDPILTQVELPVEDITSYVFSDACLSENLDLVRYLDAYAVVHDTNDEAKARLLLGRRHRIAAQTLLRFNAFTETEKVSLETINGMLMYFWETIQRQPSAPQSMFLANLAGGLYVYGKETCLYPHLKHLLRTIGNLRMLKTKIYTNIVAEHFFAGDAVNALDFLTMECIHGSWKGVVHKALEYALGSPFPDNKPAIMVALELYSKFSDLKENHRVRKELEHFLVLGLPHDHAEVLLDWIRANPELKGININLESVWVQSGCRDGTIPEKWTLDLRKCVLLILLKRDKSFSMRQLLRHFPDIFHLLEPEEIVRFQHLGFYCPKCLITKRNPWAKPSTTFQCTYCRHVW